MKRKPLALLVSTVGLSLLLSACDNAVGAPSPTPAILTVSDQEITLSLYTWKENRTETETIDRSGTYSGEILDGLPDGLGRFDAVNSNGSSWYYEGMFKSGKFAGHGACVWESGYSEIGTYNEGLFSPTIDEFYTAYSQIAEVPYTIGDKSLQFMQQHNSLFPCNNSNAKSSALNFIDTDIIYSQLTKNVSSYFDTLYQQDNAVAIQVLEDSAWGHTVTYILTSDQDMNNCLIYYNGELPDVLDGCEISFVGLPIDITGFSNVGGGITNVVVLAGCIVTIV